MDIFRIKKTYLSARRLQEIINVFIKHGFGQFIDQIHLGRFVSLRKRLKFFGKWPSVKIPTNAERLRKAFEELGPTFIKLGQLLAARPDIMGEMYIKEFKKLQDNVPPFDIKKVYEIIEKELRMSTDKIFKSFNPIPIGSASIAQVHEAILNNDKEVIVKVRRPGIREQIMSDLNILQMIARLIEKHIPESKVFEPTAIVNEFAKSITRELDFRREARNAMIFRENFKNDEKVYIPSIYSEFITEKVLIMEKIKGQRIDNISELRQMGFEPKEILKTVIDMYFKQIFEHGFFHGDPHPGNILVIKDGRVSLIDFGIVGKIDEEFKEAYANVALAIMNHDTERLIKEYLKLGIIPEDLDIEKFEKKLREDIEEILHPIYSLPIEKIQISDVIESVMKAALKYRLRFLPELLLINKVLIMLEGLTRELCPQISIIELIKPYAQNIIATRYKPEFYLGKTIKLINEVRDAFENIPLQIKRLVRKAINDQITVRMYHVNLPEFLKDIDRASNKIAFSLIVSAMILSSAIMHASQVKPLFYGISLFGLLTGIVAFFFGIWLIISIIRSGKL